MRFRLFEEKLGVQKVKFWLSVLMLFLCIATGLQLGRWVMTLLPADMANMSVREAFARVWQYLKNIKSIFGQGNREYWTVALIDVVTVSVILILVCKYLPKYRKRPENSLKDKIPDSLFIPALLAGVVVGMFLKDRFLRLLSADIGLLSVYVAEKLIMVLQDVYVKRNSTDYTYFEEHKRPVLQITTLVGMAFLGLPLWVPGFWGFTLPRILPESVDLLGYYTALLSLTFISISVMGVLSDRSVVIYWENISEGKLIRPVFGSFAAYTYYSIGATLGAGICVALNNSTAFILFGIANIVTLILLTFTMVDVYYDREGKKQKRKEQLYEDLKDYLWVRKYAELSVRDNQDHLKRPDPLTGKKSDKNYTQIEIANMRIGHRGYEEKMMLLCQYISQAYDEHDLAYLQEVYDLYVNNICCFQTPNGKRVVSQLCSGCNAETWPLLTRSIRDLLDLMQKDSVRNEDPFAEDMMKPGNRWNQDEQLWRALANAPYLQQWLQESDDDPFDAQELQDFMYLIARRLVILYNDMVTHHNLKEREKGTDLDEMLNLYNYLIVIPGDRIVVQTEEGQTPDPFQLERAFDLCFGQLMVETSFLVRLAMVLCVMINNLNDDAIALLKDYWQDFPLLQLLTPYLSMLGIPEEMQTAWEKHFPTPAKNDTST